MNILTMQVWGSCSLNITREEVEIRTTSSVRFRQQYELGRGYCSHAVSFECHETHEFSFSHKELLLLQ